MKLQSGKEISIDSEQLGQISAEIIKEMEIDKSLKEQIDKKIEKSIKDKIGNLDHYNIILIGNTGVGKSELINMFTGKKIAVSSDKINPETMYTVRYECDGLPIVIYDTRGIEYGNTTETIGEVYKAINDAKGKNSNEHIHAIWFCHNTNDPRISKEMRNALKNLNSMCGNDKPAAIIVGTKSDMSRDSDKKNFVENFNDIVSSFGNQECPRIIFTGLNRNTKKTSGVDELFKATQELCRNNVISAATEAVHDTISKDITSMLEDIHKKNSELISNSEIPNDIKKVEDVVSNYRSTLTAEENAPQSLGLSSIDSTLKQYSDKVYEEYIDDLVYLNLKEKLNAHVEKKCRDIAENEFEKEVCANNAYKLKEKIDEIHKLWDDCSIQEGLVVAAENLSKSEKENLSCLDEFVRSKPNWIKRVLFELECDGLIKIIPALFHSTFNCCWAYKKNMAKRRKSYAEGLEKALHNESIQKNTLRDMKKNPLMHDKCSDEDIKKEFVMEHKLKNKELSEQRLRELNNSIKRKRIEKELKDSVVTALRSEFLEDIESEEICPEAKIDGIVQIANHINHAIQEEFFIKYKKYLNEQTIKSSIYSGCHANLSSSVEKIDLMLEQYNNATNNEITDNADVQHLNMHDLEENINNPVVHIHRVIVHQDEKHSQIPTKAINNPTTSANTQVSICNNNDSVDPEHIYSNSEGVILTNVANGKKLNVHSAKNNENKI